MFIPYYILIYEKNLKEIERNEEKFSGLKDEFIQIRIRPEEAVQQGKRSLKAWKRGAGRALSKASWKGAWKDAWKDAAN